MTTLSTLRTSIAYDPAGHPSRHTPPNGWAPPAGTRADWLATTLYDALGRLSERQTPDGGSARAVYDDAGRLRFGWDGDGDPGAATNPAPADAQGAPQVAIRYARYDRLGRLTEQGWFAAPAWDRADLQARANGDWPRGCPTWRERRFYDAVGVGGGAATGGVGANAEGRPVQIDTRQADGRVITETAAYDANGHRVQRTTSLPGLAPETVGLAYDRAGRLTGTVLPPLAAGQAPLTLSRHYDCWGLCQGVAGPEGPLAAYRWHPDRRPAGLCLGGGLIEQQFGYSSRGDLETLDGSRFGQRLYYGAPPLDPGGDPIAAPRRNGLLSACSEHWPGDDPNATAVTSYRWDLAGQLLATTGPDGRAQEGFAYDPNGNLLARLCNGSTRTFACQGATNRLGRADARPGDWVYSPAGRLLTGPEWAFDYDFSTGVVTALASADGGTRLDFGYGAAGQRLVKTVRTPAGQVTRRYLPGATRTPVLETWQADDGTPRRIVHLDGPLGPFGYAAPAADGSLSVVYLLRDHQHSIRALVGPHGVLSRWGYHPFGLAANDDGNDPAGAPGYRFTGAEWDAETGLYNLHRRLYDPDLQRFLSPDPRGQYHSPYLYVANNPLQYADPSGEWSLKNTLGLALGASEIALGVIVILAAGDTRAGRVRGGALLGAGLGGAAYALGTGLSGEHFSWAIFSAVEGGGAVVGGLVGEGSWRYSRMLERRAQQRAEHEAALVERRHRENAANDRAHKELRDLLNGLKEKKAEPAPVEPLPEDSFDWGRFNGNKTETQAYPGVTQGPPPAFAPASDTSSMSLEDALSQSGQVRPPQSAPLATDQRQWSYIGDHRMGYLQVLWEPE